MFSIVPPRFGGVCAGKTSSMSPKSNDHGRVSKFANAFLYSMLSLEQSCRLHNTTLALFIIDIAADGVQKLTFFCCDAERPDFKNNKISPTSDINGKASPIKSRTSAFYGIQSVIYLNNP